MTAEEYNKKGVSKHKLKDYLGAIEDYDKAIGLDPNNGVLYNNRGNAQYELKDFKEAIEDFEKALDIDPGNAIYAQNRSSAITERGKGDREKEFENKISNIKESYSKTYQDKYQLFNKRRISYLNWVIGLSILVLFVYTYMVFCQEEKGLERYLISSPLIFIITIIYYGYVSAKNLSESYLHKAMVVGNLDLLRAEYEGEVDYIDKEEKIDFRKYRLDIYKELSTENIIGKKVDEHILDKTIELVKAININGK